MSDTERAIHWHMIAGHGYMKVTYEALDAWRRVSRVTTSEALCRGEALRQPGPTRIQRLWADSTPRWVDVPPLPDELWTDFVATEAADAHAMPCPDCHKLLGWEMLPNADAFVCRYCGYVIYGHEAAAWHHRHP